MKSSMKGFCVILAIIMSFVAVQAVWALNGPDCATEVSGIVTEVWSEYNAIVVDDTVVVYGIPLPWIAIEIGNSVEINAHQCPETYKLMACELKIIDTGTEVNLRPRGSK
ncbi:MAG: hypothetical protein ACMUJM_13720 [bacterium]